jgi:CRISPR-associated protein Csd2
MGRKAVVPYGLYMGRGFFSPAFAKDTGVTPEDLKIFWEAMVNMWDLDHSAARGFMSIQGLYVFTHDNPLGNAPSHMLFDRVTAALREEVKITGRVARSFDDYEMLVDDEDLPDGVSITRLIG